MGPSYGYARALAQARAKQLQQKPLFGMPHLKLGQCLGLWGYFFQLGGVLGAKHSANLDAFGHAFLGLAGQPGAVERFFTEAAYNVLDGVVSDSTTFQDLVTSGSMRRLGYTGSAPDFFTKFGMDKIKADTAVEVAWQHAEQGAALGAIHPEVLRSMFELSNSSASRESWERARAAGLDLPPQQDRISYEEAEEGEDEAFMAYCREFCPNYHAILNS